MKQLLQKIQTAFLLLSVICLSQSAIGQCGYDIELTSNDLVIQGHIYNTTGYGPDVPQNLEWYLPTDGSTFSTEAAFQMTAPAYGECSVCIDYKVIQQNGTECSEIICKAITLVDPSFVCDASFDYADYAGPMPIVGGVDFNNISSGPFTEFSWDFGDGTVDSESTGSVTHVYSESGSYEVRLIVWSGTAQDCYSEHSQTIEVYVPDNPCDQLECVWPGDTDGDGVATLADMINIGVGFGMEGPARSDVTNDWDAQAAQDWNMQNASGVNYKHFDCNGDGVIGINDIPAIHSNYAMLENGITSSATSAGAPISLRFDVDTVVITEDNQYLEINAGLYLGNSEEEIDNIYGLVLYFDYPKNYTVETSPVAFDYNENSFFGDLSEVLPLSRNTFDAGQMDMVITRKGGNNISGQGRLSTLKFIIDADIIDGRAENEGEIFPVGINLVAAVDIDGNPVEITLPEEPAGVFFQNGLNSTRTVELIEDSKIQVYPNPANDILQLKISDELHPESVEVFDILGNRVLFSEMNENQIGINVNRLAHGVYVLKVKTEEGVGTKRIMVEK